VVPKPLRDELGFTPGEDLDVQVVDGHLEVAVPSRVHVEQGPHGPRFAADEPRRLSAGQVRELMERGRR
jgi:bifunctional DNA-binding transcriptional regulator/antitoxin component of YhaV-PrlF toxin-antitoxin module